MKGLGKTSNLGAAIREALERRGLDRGIKEQELLLRWNEIVGEAVAKHTVPRRLDKGVLWIHVPDATWRMELHSMRQELLKKINSTFQEELIRDIKLQ